MSIAARGPLLSVVSIAALVMPGVAMAAAAAKQQAVTLAYDASLLQSAPSDQATPDQSAQVTMQTLPADTAQPASPAGSLVNAPGVYGASTGNNPVSYHGEVQDNDPSSTNIATARTRGAMGRPVARTMAAEPLDAGGEGGDITPAPAPMLPGQLSAFGAQPVAGRRLVIRPYIEAQQVADDQISPGGGGGVLTYSVLAVGADALINGRNTQGSVSLRYERRFGWGPTASGNGLSGMANLSTRITGGLRMDYGGYANRFQTSNSGATFADYNNSGDSLSQVYSVYAGPSLSTHSGDVAINGAYHAGYTKVDNQLNGSAVTAINTLDHSVSQDARLAVGTKPGGLGLPVGLGVEGGWFREDISNLDQRVTDLHARAQVIVPVTQSLALLGGVGAEKVQVSSRDAVRDANGNAVVDAGGRLVTNESSPRYIAFDTSGLIWDVGAQWRPSSRLSAEAHIGRRYGRLGGYGFVNWQPGANTTFNVTVYENLTGFGGALATALAGSSTEFAAIRDSITGNLSSCVGTMTGGTCIGGATGSINGQVYRGRGVTASLMHTIGRWQVGLGAGWDRRVYIAAPETVLAELNGRTDQYYWVAGYAGGKVSQRSSIQTTLALYKFESGLVANGDISAVRATGVYQYYFSRHLTGSASLAVNGMKREDADDLWTASGALGMRYSF